MTSSDGGEETSPDKYASSLGEVMGDKGEFCTCLVVGDYWERYYKL